jgi:hypothetical protein
VKKALPIIIVIIALGLGVAYFLFLQPTSVKKKSFEDGFIELKTLIGENFNDFITLSGNLSNEELSEIDSKVFQFKSKLSPENYSDIEALNSLLKVYDAMLKVNLQKNVVRTALNAENALTGDKEICANLHLFEKVDTETQELINKTKDLALKISEFKQSFPTQAETAKVFLLPIDIQLLEENQKTQENATLQLKQLCNE